MSDPQGLNREACSARLAARHPGGPYVAREPVPTGRPMNHQKHFLKGTVQFTEYGMSECLEQPLEEPNEQLGGLTA